MGKHRAVNGDIRPGGRPSETASESRTRSSSIRKSVPVSDSVSVRPASTPRAQAAPTPTARLRGVATSSRSAQSAAPPRLKARAVLAFIVASPGTTALIASRPNPQPPTRTSRPTRRLATLATALHIRRSGGTTSSGRKCIPRAPSVRELTKGLADTVSVKQTRVAFSKTFRMPPSRPRNPAGMDVRIAREYGNRTRFLGDLARGRGSAC
jgi:hypothetical protein